MGGNWVTNEERKSYTYKELSAIWRTDYKTVGKKIKKYNFKTDKHMIDGRPTTVAFLSNEEVDAVNQEIEFNRQKQGSTNGHNMGTQSAPYEASDRVPNDSPQKTAVLNQQSGMNPFEKIDILYRHLIIEKDERIKLLQESNNEKKESIQDLKETIQNLKSELQEYKKNKAEEIKPTEPIILSAEEKITEPIIPEIVEPEIKPEPEKKKSFIDWVRGK